MSDELNQNQGQPNVLGEYFKLMTGELRRLNESVSGFQKDVDTRLNELDKKITEIKTIEKDVEGLDEWKDKVTEVWSVTQMKEAKDEIYSQKSKWIAAIAILGFIEIALGIWIAIGH